MAVVRLAQNVEEEGMARTRELLSLESECHVCVLPNKITEEPLGDRRKNIIGKSLRRRISPVFATNTLVVNLVVNLIVVATGDRRQLRVHHVRFPGIILPCLTMRITDAMEQPGGCVA